MSDDADNHLTPFDLGFLLGITISTWVILAVTVGLLIVKVTA